VPPKAAKQRGLSRRQTVLRVEEFEVATSGGIWVAIRDRKHLCGNCGRDNTWSSTPIASTPLKPLHDQFSRANQYVDVIAEIDLDEYVGLPFQIWASTPAVLWTADRPQERGIHVHVHKDGEYLIDDTFGIVRYQGTVLQRSDLLKTMVAGTIN
jgi:hypothetical protein